jgi:hypothetical protein
LLEALPRTLKLQREKELTMAKHLEEQGSELQHEQVDLSESSVYGKDDTEPVVDSEADLAADAAIDRLEAITGGADAPALYEGRLGRQVEALDASTEEEVDALKVNLMQDEAVDIARDGSGRLVDDVAEEQLAQFTESGPDPEEYGGLPLAPGLQDSSAVLLRHAPNVEPGRVDTAVEDDFEDVLS